MSRIVAVVPQPAPLPEGEGGLSALTHSIGMRFRSDVAPSQEPAVCRVIALRLALLTRLEAPGIVNWPPLVAFGRTQCCILKDLKKSFRQPDGTALPVLDIPEFRVAAGEQMVLVGRSGCGKTTLLHVIAGISRPDSGKVRIDDWDITLMPEAECDRFRAERIGYVFQTFNLLAGFTALENVLLSMRFARGRPDKARAQAPAEPRGAEPSHDPSAGAALGGRAAAGGGGPGAGQQAPAPAGRRADGQRRRRPPAADPRPDARDLPGGERRR